MAENRFNVAELKNLGMHQDSSISKTSNDFAFENRNIRITSINDNTLLSVTNEKLPSEEKLKIEGTYLGHCILNKYITVFTVNDQTNTSYIYRLESIDDGFNSVLLYKGDLGFSESNPIEATPYYESEDIQKVYWVDGKNTTRVINIKEENYDQTNKYIFDFICTVNTLPVVTINKEYNGSGEFKSGVIQYFISYYNKFGSESKIVYGSPLYYISPSDRGGKADENIICNFRIQIAGVDTNFEYLRLYSVKRASLDGPLEVNVVADVKTDKNIIDIYDYNKEQETIDPNQFYFIGGSDFVASTIEQKDDTLFLGDIKLEDTNDSGIQKLITESVKNGSTSIAINRYKGESNYVDVIDPPYNPDSPDTPEHKDPEVADIPVEKTYVYSKAWAADETQYIYGKFNEVVTIKTTIPNTYLEFEKYTNTQYMVVENIDEQTAKLCFYAPWGNKVDSFVYIKFKNSSSACAISLRIDDSNAIRYNFDDIPTGHIYIDGKSNQYYIISSNREDIEVSGVNTGTSGAITRLSNNPSTVRFYSWFSEKGYSTFVLNYYYKRTDSGDINKNYRTQYWVTINWTDVQQFNYTQEWEGTKTIRLKVGEKALINVGQSMLMSGSYLDNYTVSKHNWIKSNYEATEFTEKKSLAITCNGLYPKSTITVTKEDGSLCYIDIIRDDSSSRSIDDITPLSEDTDITTTSVLSTTPSSSKKNVFGLNQNSRNIKTYHYDDWYRFGIQFINNKCEWTQAYYINDVQCKIRPRINSDGKIDLPDISFKLDQSLPFLNDFIGYRLVMVETNNSTRTVLTQGICCPTIFNQKQRSENKPFAQSSWIMRPNNGNASNLHYDSVGTGDDSNAEIQGIAKTAPINLSDEEPIDTSAYEYKVVIHSNDNKKHPVMYFDILKKGTSQFDSSCIYTNSMSIENSDDFESLNKLNDWIAKEFSLVGITNVPLISNSSAFDAFFDEVTKYEWIKKLNQTNIQHYYNTSKSLNNYYIDRSIITMDTPEIDNVYYNVNNVENLRFRVIAYEPVVANVSDVELITENNLSTQANVKSILSKNSISRAMRRTLYDKPQTLLSDYLFSDYYFIKSNDKEYYKVEKFLTDYKVFMWGKTGSLNGQPSNAYDEQLDSPLYEKTSVLKKKKIANYRNCDTIHYIPSFERRINKPVVFNSDNITISKLDNVYYYGNYDNLLTETNGYYVKHSSFNEDEKINYPLVYDPIRIKYKTNSHIVIEYANDENNIKSILPTLVKANELTKVYNIKDVWNTNDSVTEFEWNNNTYKYYNDKIHITDKSSVDDLYFPQLLIGELYKPDWTASKAYGDTSNNTLERHTWIPISDQIYFTQSYVGNTEGDTYFQKWECLKSYPFTEEDENAVIDISSVFIESHINLDGRCDVNKESMNILNARPTNYNLFNEVYNQSNNINKYNHLDEKYDNDKFGSQIAWSLTKKPTEDIDTWTNISLANILNVNGSNGNINKIINVNDRLITFQDKAICAINFNPRVQISTEQGVPIQLANSGKVEGYNTITNNNGCVNKWSILNTDGGLYFIDDYNKSFMSLTKDGIVDIGKKCEMSNWFKKSLNGIIWNPSNNGFKCLYDNINKDIYIKNNNNTLLYNEYLQSFTSFMDYYRDSMFMYSSLFKKTYVFNKEKFYTNSKELFGGKYVNDYSITYKVNPEPYSDKTFTNIDIIADCIPYDTDIDTVGLNSNEYPFETLNVWTEYQKGSTDLRKSKYANALKKFRIWRLDIPRDENSRHNLDRIRNPWMYLKLSKLSPNVSKLVFHNAIIKYFK